MAQKRRRIVVAAEIAFLAAAVAFLILSIEDPSIYEKVQAAVLPREPVVAAQAAPPVKVDNVAAVKQPAIMTVPPRQMYAVFADQYRIRPDRRIVLAFGTLARRWEQSRGDAGSGRFAAGAVRSDGVNVVIPLLRDGAAVRETVLPVPASFAQARALLDEWAGAMDGGAEKPPPAASGRPGASAGTVEEAVRLIDTVDPRYVVAGLSLLEKAWRDGTRDARVLRAAARGYATLLLVLYPDEMGLADPFAAEALAFLALARRADPNLSLAREEALLAMTMGYRAHAARLLESVPSRIRTPADKVLDAYMRQDMVLLKRARKSDSGVLGAYLLARHYREIGLSQEAKAASRQLLTEWPTLYPSAVEIIHSGDIGEERILTILYPHEITEQVRTLVDPAALKSLPSWIGLVKKIVDGRVMPLSEFQGLLDRWEPFGDDNSVRFIVDADRVKTIFRSLYADAVHFRFRLLFDRWGVRDPAREYVESLAATDNTHPLVMLMRGKVAAERGNRDAADRLFERVISSGGAGGDLAYSAYRGLSDPLAKCRLLPAAVAQMDGRPGNVILAGWLLGDEYNYDLAARFYAAGLAEDPYAYWAHAALAHVRGTDAPLREALKNNPNSYNLLKEAAEYLAKEGDAASKEAGERAFAAAQTLAPSVGLLARERARVLRDLGHHGKAIKVLDAWIERYGDDGLATIVTNALRAEIYLRMGQPRDALRVLGDDAESMQGNALAAAAETHEALGDLAAAWNYHRRGVERYPTNGPTLAGAAAFLWRQGRYDEAATVIAGGRPSQKRFDRWYYEKFMSVFVEAPGDNVARAVAALKARGAPSDELEALAYGLNNAGRSEVAFRIASELRDPITMLDLERRVDAYGILRGWKGKEAASDYLRKSIPPNLKPHTLIVLYERGYYNAILEEAGDPATYGKPHDEFVWLQKLLAWLALDRKPPDLAEAFDAHYRGVVRNKYHSIGRYMLGMISRDDLLDTVRADKDRCEFAYYIGFAERLKGNFAEAAQWYHLCKETLLRNNGELHWADKELALWTHMGIEGRHRLVTDDVAERDRARARNVSGRTVM